MDKKDFLIRAIECRIQGKPDHRFECLICPYGKGLDFSQGDNPDDVVCNKEKILQDMEQLIPKDYGATYDYMRNDFTDGKADVCERICQSLMKNGVLRIERTEHYDRVRFKWILCGIKQTETE